MSDSHELMLPGEFLMLLILIGLLVFVGNQMARPNALTYQQAGRFTETSILLYAIVSLLVSPPASVIELLSRAVRTLLAGGVVFGASTLILAIVHRLVGDPVTVIKSKYQEWIAEFRLRAAEERERQEAAANERRIQAEHALKEKLRVEDQRRRADEDARETQESERRIEEAQGELIRFYDDHAQWLGDTLPPALFRSRLQTQFGASISPEEAWKAVHETIAGMLPLIAAGREKQRTECDQARERDREAHRLRRDIRAAEDEIEALTQSATGDPDVRDPEVRALRQQIREWEAELEALGSTMGALS